MKNHVLRPLWVAIALVALFLLARHFMVPKDFGVHGKNFTYGYHRLGNIDEWKEFKVKYKGKEYCLECHEERYQENTSSKHAVIQCENCHGPAIDHPENPETLDIPQNRLLCLRCHAYLPYPGNTRSQMQSIDPEKHNPGSVCTECHNPHNPNLEDM